MRKAYEAIKGDVIRNIRSNELYLVCEVGNTFVIVNQDTQIAKTTSLGTIKRWYKMEKEYVEPEIVEVPPTPIVEIDKPSNDVLTQVKVNELVEALGLTIKVNKTNMAIRYGKKNVMELTYSARKNHFTMLIRHDAITSEDRLNYEVNNDAKIVGKGYTLDLSIKTNSLAVFTKVLQDAKRYEVQRITR